MALRHPIGRTTNRGADRHDAGGKRKCYVRAMESASPRPCFADPVEAALALALGDSATALSALERSQRTAGPVWTEYIGIFDHAYDLVRQSPRFTALVLQSNLDPGRFDPVRRGR
jgi:hypothetical protein